MMKELVIKLKNYLIVVKDRIETERLVLRGFRESDYDDLYEFLKDTYVYAAINGDDGI